MSELPAAKASPRWKYLMIAAVVVVLAAPFAYCAYGIGHAMNEVEAAAEAP